MSELLEVLDFIERSMSHSSHVNFPLNQGYYEAMREVKEMIDFMIDQRAKDIIG